MTHPQLRQSIDEVLELKTYTPSTKVNDSFTALVRNIVNTSGSVALPAQKSKLLRAASSSAEGELECYWAQKIINAKNPQETLQQFPYVDNYKDLVKRELDCLKRSGANSITSALIIGSGPLPLTAMELQSYGIDVDHNDASPSALALCEDLLKKLSIEGGHILGKGESILLNKKYDLILVAALAGTTQEDKQHIIDNVLPSLTDSGRILLRSARGARSLLYPELDAHAFRGVTLLHAYHPDDHVINSVLVYKKGDR